MNELDRIRRLLRTDRPRQAHERARCQVGEGMPHRRHIYKTVQGRYYEAMRDLFVKTGRYRARRSVPSTGARRADLNTGPPTRWVIRCTTLEAAGRETEKESDDKESIDSVEALPCRAPCCSRRDGKT